MSKRPSSTQELIHRVQRHRQTGAAPKKPAANTTAATHNHFLSHPVNPTQSIQNLLHESRTTIRKLFPHYQQFSPTATLACEVEARLGLLQQPQGQATARLLSSGAKKVQNPTTGKWDYAPAFDCTMIEDCMLECGVSRRHVQQWTHRARQQQVPTWVASAFGVSGEQMEVVQSTEAVYSYADHRRLVFAGEHCPEEQPPPQLGGTFQVKQKLTRLDLTIPAALYDVRMALSTETVLQSNVPQPMPRWNSKRVNKANNPSTCQCPPRIRIPLPQSSILFGQGPCWMEKWLLTVMEPPNLVPSLSSLTC